MGSQRYFPVRNRQLPINLFTQLFLDEFDKGGRGLAAASLIRKGTRLLNLPKSLLLTAAVATRGEVII